MKIIIYHHLQMDTAFLVLALQLLYILNITQGKSSADMK